MLGFLINITKINLATNPNLAATKHRYLFNRHRAHFNQLSPDISFLTGLLWITHQRLDWDQWYFFFFSVPYALTWWQVRISGTPCRHSLLQPVLQFNILYLSQVGKWNININNMSGSCIKLLFDAIHYPVKCHWMRMSIINSKMQYQEVCPSWEKVCMLLEFLFHLEHQEAQSIRSNYLFRI